MGRVNCWTDRSDAELVEAIREGTTEAFGELYQRHAGGARRAISDNVRNPESQLDLVQESFTRALKRLDTLREPSQFRPWLFQIARNAAIDDRRARTAAPQTQLGDDGVRDLASDDPMPEVEAEVRDLAAALSSGVAALSERDAAALSLTVHLGFGPAEVAAALDISYGNAKVVLHRARSRLRAAMEQQQMLDAVVGTPE